MRLKYVFYSNYKRLSHQIEYRRCDLFALRQGRSASTLGCWSVGALAHRNDRKSRKMREPERYDDQARACSKKLLR
jgi:hypothetical protein